MIMPIVVKRPTFQLHFGLGKDILMLMVIVAAETSALRSTHFADREALTIHFDAVCFLAGAS